MINGIRLKVCGLTSLVDAEAADASGADYLGFIFYNRSKRNFTGTIPELPKHIKKTGVFVNEELSIVVSLQEKYQLKAIQLHGDESVAYVQELKRSLSNKIEIIKVGKIEEILKVIFDI